MAPWSYHNPVAVTFGWNSLERLPQVLAGREAVVVTFPEARGTRLEERIAQLLGAKVREVISDVEPNPEVRWFDSRYPAFWQRHGGAVLVAVGGGSVIDTAKLLQVAGADRSFEAIRAPLAAGAQPDVRQSCPLIAVPTTAGTGSEVTPWATLWERGTSAPKKYSLHTPRSWPEAAIVDPSLALSAPPAVTRNSALDALSHSLESIWNVNSNPVSDTLAVEAARTVIATLPGLMSQPNDAALRTRMARAATMAGLAFSNTRTALAHSVSYEMTLRHGLPHGLACSFTLPMVWRMAEGTDAARDEVLKRIFGAEVRDAPARLEEFLHGVGVATRFADYGVSHDEAERMVAHGLEGARGKNFIGRKAAVPA
jgi:phosphonate metabolism-associated iron-containing alcohol dehydrogenase